MSVYRMLRFAAIAALLRRYRQRLVRMLFAVAFALVTAWLYGDIAQFLRAHHPQWAGPALAIKTVIVYVVLFYCIWELQRIVRGDAEMPRQMAKQAAADPPAAPSPLDQLVDKPKLKSRRDAILEDEPRRH